MEVKNIKSLTLNGAQKMIASALKKAEETETKMIIAVLDSTGNLMALNRMDDAWIGSTDIAIKKAKTAFYFKMNTGDIGELSQPGKPLFGIEHSNQGLISFPGGIPLLDEQGNLLGAIGVSGDSVENDHIVAEAGIKAVK